MGCLVFDCLAPWLDIVICIYVCIIIYMCLGTLGPYFDCPGTSLSLLRYMYIRIYRSSAVGHVHHSGFTGAPPSCHTMFFCQRRLFFTHRVCSSQIVVFLHKRFLFVQSSFVVVPAYLPTCLLTLGLHLLTYLPNYPWAYLWRRKCTYINIERERNRKSN